MPIRIHSDHFIVEEQDVIVDYRFIEIPQRFRRKINSHIPFGEFEPDINEICQLLISPCEIGSVDLNVRFMRRDIVSMIGYFSMNAPINEDVSHHNIVEANVHDQEQHRIVDKNTQTHELSRNPMTLLVINTSSITNGDKMASLTYKPKIIWSQTPLKISTVTSNAIESEVKFLISANYPNIFHGQPKSNKPPIPLRIFNNNLDDQPKSNRPPTPLRIPGNNVHNSEQSNRPPIPLRIFNNNLGDQPKSNRPPTPLRFPGNNYNQTMSNDISKQIKEEYTLAD